MHNRYIVLSDLRSNDILTIMEYIANINIKVNKCPTGKNSHYVQE